MSQTRPNRSKCPCLRRPLIFLGATLACIGLESITGLDRLVEDIFFIDGRWLIAPEFHNQYKALLYTLPKVLIAACGALALAGLGLSLLPRFRFRLLPWRGPLLATLAAIIVIPLTVAALKACTGIYSPVDLLPYGGSHPHTGLLEQLWTQGRVAGGRSFPAGHASGGFALLGLTCLAVNGRQRTILLLAALAAGWLMGLYQMARGEHFLSHTLTTMFIGLTVTAWLCGRLRSATTGPAGAKT